MSQPSDREPDDLDLAFRAMGDLLAGVPHQLGYRLEGSDQLAIQVSGPGGRFLLPIEWPADQSNLQAARQSARTIEAVTRLHPSNAVLLLGYGPEAAERVYALREALSLQLDGADISIAAVQVDQGQWRAFGIGVTGDWHPVPEVPVSILMAGYPAPAASLQEYRQQYQPLPQPTYGDLPDSSRELIDASPPGIKVELADRALQRLADREPAPLDLPALAHVLNDPAVNHAVVAHNYNDRPRLGSLVDAYRGAPPQHQPALAVAAATASGSMAASRKPGRSTPTSPTTPTSPPAATSSTPSSTPASAPPRAHPGSSTPPRPTSSTLKPPGQPTSPQCPTHHPTTPHHRSPTWTGRTSEERSQIDSAAQLVLLVLLVLVVLLVRLVLVVLLVLVALLVTSSLFV